ncbi:alpha/beta hydrolase [Spirillospora sp. NPDC029432]|uniref:alpha/beta hydrolase n=1 Tax=Spirillospora sp. NPDC029432 TaxID=3154599 RepID=UPI0034543D99
MAVPGGAQATPPDPTASVPSLTPGSPTGSPSESGTPGSRTPSTPPATGGGQPAGGADAVSSSSAVMVTPKPPKASTYAYGRHPRQRLDAYWRPGTGTGTGTGAEGQEGQEGQENAQARRTPPGPAVLLFHGGSWITGDKSSWKYFARRLTNEGYTVFSANYRLAHQAAWPAQRDDAMAALDFVKRNAARWNIDPDRIVAFGSSAGGLLASQLGTYGQGAQRVRGVLALSPVNTPYLAYQDGLKADATGGQRYLRRAVVKLVGCVPNEADPECWQRVDDSNATTHAGAGDAPALLMHAAEELVPSTHSTALASALRGAGVGATVKVVPGDGHASELLEDATVYPAIRNWLRARTK